MRFGRRARDEAHIVPAPQGLEERARDVPAEASADGPSGLSALPVLLDGLRAAGHTVRFTDRIPDEAVPAEVGRALYRVAECGIGAIRDHLPADQELHVRLRVDGHELVGSVQSHGLDGKNQRGLVPREELREIPELLDRIRGRMTLRRTASGNWIAVVVVPLRDPPRRP